MNIRGWIAGLTRRKRSPEQLTASFQHPAAAVIPPEFRRYLETYAVTNMRYPPYQEGYPGLVSGEWFMRNHQRELYERIEGSVGLPYAEFKQYLEPVIVRFAELAHLLPASENHHHAGAGGLIRHSLEVSALTLDRCLTTAFDAREIPARRSLRRFRWNAAGVIAGLLHDAGKPLSDVTAMDHTGEHRWIYGTETIHEWSQRLDIQRYFLLWSPDRHHRHVEVSLMLLGRIVPDVTLKWLLEGGQDIQQSMVEAVAGTGKSVLADAVRWADGRSVEREMRRGSRGGTGGDTGVPVPRLVLDAMQRLISDGRWTVNAPGARVWSTTEGIFIAWTQGAEDVVGLIAQDGMPIPRSPDTLAGVLKSHSIIQPATGGELYWLVSPHALMKDGKGPALKCIKLADADMLFPFTPVPPPVSVSLGKEGAKQALIAPGDLSAVLSTPEDDPLAAICGAASSPPADTPPSSPVSAKAGGKHPKRQTVNVSAAASKGVSLEPAPLPDGDRSNTTLPDDTDAQPEEELEAFSLDEMLLGLTPQAQQSVDVETPTEPTDEAEPEEANEAKAPLQAGKDEPTLEQPLPEESPELTSIPGEKIPLDVLLGKRAPSKKPKPRPTAPSTADTAPAAKPELQRTNQEEPQPKPTPTLSGWEVPPAVAEKLTRREILLLQLRPVLAQKLLQLELNSVNARYVFGKVFLAFKSSAFEEEDIPAMLEAGWIWQDFMAEDNGIVRIFQRLKGFVLAADYSRILVKLMGRSELWPVSSADDFTDVELDVLSPIVDEVVASCTLDSFAALKLWSITPGALAGIAETHEVDPKRLEEALHALRDVVRSHVRKRIYIRPLTEELREQ